MAKNMSNSIVPLKEQGIKNLVGSPVSGVSVQIKKVTLSGDPTTVTLTSIGLVAMADTNYAVIVQGEFAAATRVDESTITTTSFDIIGGAAAEVAHLVIVGRVRGQSA